MNLPKGHQSGGQIPNSERSDDKVSYSKVYTLYAIGFQHFDPQFPWEISGAIFVCYRSSAPSSKQREIAYSYGIYYKTSFIKIIKVLLNNNSEI